ncbi:MAG: cytochrome c3 family protein [Terriglobales bacterium]
MKAILFACILIIATLASAQQATDVLGSHDLSVSLKGGSSAACLYCHVPHSGSGKTALWGQSFSSQVYSLYSSDTAQNTAVQPPLGAASTLCLSCHDGTVAPGQVSPIGPIQMGGTMTSVMGSNLESSHPFSLALPLKDSAHLVASLAASQTTADPTKSVQLIKGNVECTSCHNPHAQAIDRNAPKFLVRDNRNGALCLSCHETALRTVNARENPLTGWTTSVHATTGAQVSITSGLGGYNTVGEFACLSCHVPHNASAPEGLLRNPAPPIPNVDTTSQSCINCHNGSDKLLVPLANVLAEFQKPGHPFPSGASSAHSPIEPVVLEQNRHAACADCHNPHATKTVTAFDPPPNLRPSQYGAKGVASDGSVLTGVATKQYETCLRCHGASSGKQVLTAVYGYLPARAAFSGDPLNLIPQFGDTAISAHPVMREATLQSQPSLLPYMLDLTGTVQKRQMGTRIFCTDCHNSDDNREFGGNGPNGPHGSQNTHILERRYEISQVAVGAWPTGGPGSPIINLNPSPPLDAASGGPYALCAKCHDLQNVNSNVSFAQHSEHIQKGFSCSVCHTAHGVPAGSQGISGRRLVNFDVNVVAPNNGVLSYSNGTCVLICHGKTHN